MDQAFGSSGVKPTERWVGGPIDSAAQSRRTISLQQLFADRCKINIGRAPECELCLPHPMVSRRHAELERTADGSLSITDLGSMNGITVGGQRLFGSSLLRDRDQVGIGPFLFSLSGQVLNSIDSSRGLRLEAQDLAKVVALPGGKSRKLLDNINLVIEPGEFVSVLGPSGSGKSTLMDCLNGRRRASAGRVLANGEDFYRHFSSFRQSLGYVPQRDIVHTQLTVSRALFYTAQLRLPTDTSASELRARMEEVIRQMELEPHRDTLIGNLSGGQIKRVSLGAELLAQPSLLYIDEATSGLDAGIEARLMRLFRSLADDGKSLLCITHNLENVDHCHLIVVLARGKLMYYGPPAEATAYFGVHRLSEIYDRLADKEIDAWENEYTASSLCRQFVKGRLAPQVPAAVMPPAESGAMAPTQVQPVPSWAVSTPLPAQRFRPKHVPWWHQFRVLTTRYAELLWNDRRSLRLLLMQAPLVVLFILAGFVGKPFQQKLRVPHVSDDEYLALLTIKALDQDPDGGEGDRGRLPGRLSFQVSENGSDEPATAITLPMLRSKLKQWRGGNQTDDLERIQITVEQPGPGSSTPTVTRSALQLLDLQRTLHDSAITDQLIEAHEVADTTNPRYTYALVFLISIIVLWFGCNNAAKEIVKEEAIYGRERAVNLGITPYLASKFLVLSVITIFQAAVLMVMIYGTLHALHFLRPSFLGNNQLPAPEYMLPYDSQFGMLCLLSMTGVALGLLLSACVATPDRANALLPYVLIPQIILGGAFMPVQRGLLEWLAWFLSPEYWAFRAIRLGECTLPNILAEQRMHYDDNLWLPCLALVLQTSVLLIATAWFLRKKDVRQA